MKKLLLIVFVLALTLPTLAQQKSNLFTQLTDQYSDKEGFSASQITSEMFDLYLKKKNIENDSPVSEALKSLEKIVVVSQSKYGRSAELISGGYIKPSDVEEKDAEEKNVLHKQILDYYKKSNFTLLKTEKRMGEDVKVYINKPNDNINSLALITNSSVSTNLVELSGDIDLKTVSELNQALNLRGLENLYKIDNNSSSYGVFPSSGYRQMSEERIEEMVKRQHELFGRQHELTEEQQAKIEKQAQEMAEKQMQMAEKYREMAEKYRRQPIFLSAPGDTNTVYFLDGKKVKAAEIKALEKEKIKGVEVSNPAKNDEKTTIKIKTK